MRTYLVTGGAGFIGSNYIHYMFRKYDNEIRIINVDALTYAGNLENLKDIENRDNYTFIKADITDKDAIMKIFEENDIDRVVHFAAESHVDRSIKNPEVFVKTNVLGTAVMLNCAKKAWELPDGSFKTGKKFLHVSTDEVYGSLPDDGKSYFYETTPYQPHSPYSASKASSDMLVKAYIDTYHFPANVTNTSNNYGPYQFPEKLIPLIINNALHGKKLPVYGDGKNVRDWLLSLGIKEDEMRLRDHSPEELCFYSKGTTDIEFLFPFGWGELWGIADRTDYDLTQHANTSGEDMTYFDDEKKEKYIPYVIEPSLGADRVVLAFLCAAYDEEELEGGDVRTVLHFHPALAPVKIGVLPLSKKLNEGAEKIYTELSKKYNCEFDDRGNIGKRYRRQDEIGTPFCVTYDFDSETDGCVTVRFRDSMEQERVAIKDLDAYFADKFTF